MRGKIILTLWLIFNLAILVIMFRSKAPNIKPEKISILSIQKQTETDKVQPIFEDVIFPENFFFGTASSDFQTTGGNGLTDWDEYIQDCMKSQRCPPDSKTEFVGPGVGTDFLNRYREDFDWHNRLVLWYTESLWNGQESNPRKENLIRKLLSNIKRSWNICKAGVSSR